MNRLLLILLAATLLAPALFSADDEDEAKWEAYEKIDYNLLQVSPEKYKNKKVSYEGKYLGYTNTFPRYMEDSGFDSNKYWGIGLSNLKVPAIAKKSRYKDLDEILATLKPSATVRFYGKVKKFRHEPVASMLPTYYLELAHLEIVNATPSGPLKGEDGGKRVFPGRHKR